LRARDHKCSPKPSRTTPRSNRQAPNVRKIRRARLAHTTRYGTSKSQYIGGPLSFTLHIRIPGPSPRLHRKERSIPRRATKWWVRRVLSGSWRAALHSRTACNRSQSDPAVIRTQRPPQWGHEQKRRFDGEVTVGRTEGLVSCYTTDTSRCCAKYHGT
jgi:hypothetical protein